METLKLPPLVEGEIYVGCIGDAAGNLHHVILLPCDNDDASWQDAQKWAKSLGGDLPNRIEQSILWANHRDQFQEDWYWSNETYELNPAYAWYQHFDDGYQSISHKDNRYCRARAVRRLPI